MISILFYETLGPLAYNSNTIEIGADPTFTTVRIRPQYLIKLPRNKINLLNNENYKVLLTTNDFITISTDKYPNQDIINSANYFIEDFNSKIKKFDYPDPEWPISFYANNIGAYGGTIGEDINVKKAWEKGISGNNVTLVIADDGCYTTHYDFMDRFNNNLNLAFSAPFDDINPQVETDSHGTACLGMAAASSNNYCSIGVAPNSTIGCHRFGANDASIGNIVKSLTTSLNDIDVISFSWGVECDPSSSARCYFYQSHPVVDEALDKSVTQGRNGKGRIIVFAAGNEQENGQNSNEYLLNKDRRVISVSASTYKGSAAYYTAPGSNILVNTPSGGDSSFMAGSDYTPTLFTSSIFGDSSCTNTFTGSSASCPQVAGCCALMLQVNKELTWRDVQMILALTSTINDPESIYWKKNGAGYLYSHYSGFGRINVDLAVETSKNWKNLPKEKKIFFTKFEKFTSNKFRELPKYVNFTVDSNDIKFIESVVVNFMENNTTDISLLKIWLISPSKTVSYFKPLSNSMKHVSSKLEYSFTLRDFLGEEIQGNWTIKIQNEDPFQIFEFSNFTLNFYGCENKPDLPKITKLIGNSELSPKINKNMTIKSTSPEFKCGEINSILIEAAEDFQWNNFPSISSDMSIFKTYFGRTPAIAFQDPELIVNFSIPCIFNDWSSEKVTMSRFRRNYNYGFNATVLHENVNNVTGGVILSPKPNSLFKSGESFEINYELWLDNKQIESTWDSRIILRLVDADTKKEIFRRNENWNNGHINATINDKFVCKRCLLTLTPTTGKICDTMILPIKIVSSGSTEVPEDIFYEMGNCTEEIQEDSDNSRDSGDGKDDKDKNKWKFDTKMIVLVTLTAVFILVIIITLIIYIVKRRRRNIMSNNASAVAALIL
ncbi:Clan SB, family S8, subtilisin-like serine peptidase [Trichomonas vaginalis G3]|uniref:Clan SB, family S8, subtilisin-like serine peptidase n=1 Tax=Trichomonas vaginalis (strain ATCC PRA-98 / G3) TaxID=412133 RepID=A2DMA3_TRIV3|nr:proprotein convertase subtilisin/kexin-related family [Trichomonas vaginalis G3]EAY18523.1 Clan SB, family S8, subtilisin-like serine peptidase [Trichomonas vaginalis G3]KAI5489487.1 proprotein convertase subtilisin/kexin-related family [Trichomonas vaginalis G3]|eukprot:XP_001579509.1 Clan SB, family S8, subtilisin-like serine peptidase [Trichomonas vaginalis G3]